MQGSLAEIATNFKTLHMPDVDRAKAREELTTSPIYSELIASRDGKVTALQITLNELPQSDRQPLAHICNQVCQMALNEPPQVTLIYIYIYM